MANTEDVIKEHFPSGVVKCIDDDGEISWLFADGKTSRANPIDGVHEEIGKMGLIRRSLEGFGYALYQRVESVEDIVRGHKAAVHEIKVRNLRQPQKPVKQQELPLTPAKTEKNWWLAGDFLTDADYDMGKFTFREPMLERELTEKSAKKFVYAALVPQSDLENRKKYEEIVCTLDVKLVEVLEDMPAHEDCDAGDLTFVWLED